MKDFFKLRNESRAGTNSVLDYDKFVGKGQVQWMVKYSYGAGRGGQRETEVGFLMPANSKEADVKKAWNKSKFAKGKKYISAKNTGIVREGKLQFTTTSDNVNAWKKAVIKQFGKKGLEWNDGPNGIQQVYKDGELLAQIKPATKPKQGRATKSQMRRRQAVGGFD